MIQDLLPVDRSHPNPPKVIIADGDKHPVHTEHALCMKDLPNVSLEPVHGCDGHHAWARLLEENKSRPS